MFLACVPSWSREPVLMKAVRRALFYVLLILVLVFWTVFTVYNPTPHVLAFLGWQSIGLPISVWLLISFIAGGICGVLLCTTGYVRGKSVQRQLKLELERTQAEKVEPNEEAGVKSNKPRPMSVSDTPATPATTDESRTSI